MTNAFNIANKNNASIVRRSAGSDDFTATYATVDLADMAATAIEDAGAGTVFRMGKSIGVMPS